MSKIIDLSSAPLASVADVGAKAAALGDLISYGAPVPPGFIVPPTFDIEGQQSQLMAAFDSLGHDMVAVRSSAAVEAGASDSWAGGYESFLQISKDQLADRIKDCRQSGESDRAGVYSDGGNVAIAVIVQAMVPSDCSGILFTANPATVDRSRVVIEAVLGLGELLVQGTTTPDHFIVNKLTAEVTEQTIATKTIRLDPSPTGVKEEFVPRSQQREPAITPDHIAQLTRLATELEAKFEHALDIEWAFVSDTCYVLQARPITSL